METEHILGAVSLAASLIYGVFLGGRRPTVLRMAVKTAAVGALAVLAFVSGAPWLLVAALAFSALGDAFMADPDRFLPPGLGAFLIAHILYTPLFLGFAVGAGPARLAAIVLVIAMALVLLRWLWPGLGKLKGAVIAYVLAIGSMVSTSFLLPSAMWAAMVGAVLFMASDALLAGQLFRKVQLAGRATDQAVWFLYWGGQALIAWAFIA